MRPVICGVAKSWAESWRFHPQKGTPWCEWSLTSLVPFITLHYPPPPFPPLTPFFFLFFFLSSSFLPSLFHPLLLLLGNLWHTTPTAAMCHILLRPFFPFLLFTYTFFCPIRMQDALRMQGIGVRCAQNAGYRSALRSECKV